MVYTVASIFPLQIAFAYMQLGFLCVCIKLLTLHFSPAILSVYDKTDLVDLARGLVKHNVRLITSGGTARLIRDAGISVE